MVKKSRLLIAVLMVAIVYAGNGYAQPETNVQANLEELSLPVANSKMVIAHCMTNIIRYKGHRMEDSCDPEFYPATGNITEPLGGLTQVHVLSDEYLSGKTLEEAVEFEMRAAIMSGIDAFQFYYIQRNPHWDHIIETYFKVAEEKQLPFKFALCISHPNGGTQASRVNEFAKRINGILQTVGRHNKHWLRTPDGRLVMYTWMGDGLADFPAHADKEKPARYVAAAYHQLGMAIGEKLACFITINEMISDKKLNDYLDYFPAVWLWTLPYTDTYIGERIRAVCKARNRSFTASAFPDFYTSKLLKRGTWDMYHTAAEAVKAGWLNTERKYIVTGLSYNFRKQLEFALASDVNIINIITWNDYPEGHHFAPEANHNDGFSLLLQYYKALWQQKDPPFDRQDIVIAFYKKYAHHRTPEPFNYRVTEIEKPGISRLVEDSVEVITITKQAGSLRYGNITKPVDRGLQSTKFAPGIGAVVIHYAANGIQPVALHCTEWITDSPYRTDLLTYSYSNLTMQYLHLLLGANHPPPSQEYNKELNPQPASLQAGGAQ